LNAEVRERFASDVFSISNQQSEFSIHQFSIHQFSMSQ